MKPSPSKSKEDEDSDSNATDDTEGVGIQRDNEWPSFVTDSPNSSASQLNPDSSSRRLGDTSFLSIVSTSTGPDSSKQDGMPPHEKLSSQDIVSQTPQLPPSELLSQDDRRPSDETAKTSNQSCYETFPSPTEQLITANEGLSSQDVGAQSTELPPSEISPENQQELEQSTPTSNQYTHESLHPPSQDLFPNQESISQTSTNWHHGSDTTPRQEMIENIVTLLQQMEKEENWEWIGKVTEMVKQLELSLYESAPSFQAYADKKTLKQRLQSCTMEFANRDSRQQLSGADSNQVNNESGPTPVSSSQQQLPEQQIENESNEVLPLIQSAAQNNPILTTAKIEDAWNSWAFAMFAQQGLIYFVLMACIMIIEWIDNTNAKISISATIGVGWLYFVRLEGLKMWRSFVQYFYNFWNVWCILTLILILLSLISDILDISSPNGTFRITMPREFLGTVHFFVLINFLHYCKGNESIAWILYALKRLGLRILPFLFLLLWILIAASLQLTKIDEAFGSRRVIPVFTETYLATFFGVVETFDDSDGPYHPDSVSALLVSLSLVFIIFTYTMIAFISEDYANILDQKTSILALQKSIIILDMYCVMGKRGRESKKDQYQAICKFYEETSLNEMDSKESERDFIGKRSTKDDIIKIESRLREENIVMKEEVSEIRKENFEIRKDNAEMNKKLSEMTEMLSKLVIDLTSV